MLVLDELKKYVRDVLKYALFDSIASAVALKSGATCILRIAILAKHVPWFNIVENKSEP